MHNKLKSFIWALALFAGFASTAHAAPGKFKKVPGAKAGDLEMRTVEYKGSTNGRMVIEVRNRGKAPHSFEAEGLYFVPGGDPEKAPQRLGAAGPFEVVTDKGTTAQPTQAISVGPGQSRKLELHVFCIDSHRSSPSAATPFKVAKDRMPKKLRNKIGNETKKIMKKNDNRMKRKASSAIQSHVWKTRDADWIELQGERKQEKAIKHKSQRQQRRR